MWPLPMTSSWRQKVLFVLFVLWRRNYTTDKFDFLWLTVWWRLLECQCTLWVQWRKEKLCQFWYYRHCMGMRIICSFIDKTLLQSRMRISIQLYNLFLYRQKALKVLSTIKIWSIHMGMHTYRHKHRHRVYLKWTKDNNLLHLLNMMKLILFELLILLLLKGDCHLGKVYQTFLWTNNLKYIHFLQYIFQFIQKCI